jgi:hypothetical protein
MGSRPEIGRAALLVVVLVAMLAPGGAEAASVVNGNFESGTLNGWQLSRETGAGNWFAYTGTDPPIGSKRPKPADPVQPPPQGAFAATADQANPDTLILYQDVALEPGLNHQLSLLAYYDSYRPIAVPSPDTLSVADEALGLPNGKVQKNQQFRIDVIRPEAPLESLDPADVLRTVFATRPGDPLRMTPRRLSTDLSAFAGQTVRIRIATAVTEEVLNAGVDAVSISTPGRGQAGSRGSKHGPTLFSFGRLRTNRRNGIATLRVRVSGPGLVRAKGAAAEGSDGRLSKRGALRKPIEPITVPVASAKTVAIHLRPTPSVRAILRRERRFRVKVAVTFRPLAGAAETATVPLVLRLDRRPPRQR